jgi:hypothetical protein
MRQGFDGDVVTGINLDDRLEQLTEVAPMDGFRGRWQIVMVRLALPRRRRLARSRRDERSASGRQRCCAAGSEECAFEKAAPLGIEIVEQLLAVELELRAIAIITCTHRISPVRWPKTSISAACEAKRRAGVMQ